MPLKQRALAKLSLLLSIMKNCRLNFNFLGTPHTLKSIEPFNLLATIAVRQSQIAVGWELMGGCLAKRLLQLMFVLV